MSEFVKVDTQSFSDLRVEDSFFPGKTMLRIVRANHQGTLIDTDDAEFLITALSNALGKDSGSGK